MKCCFNLFPATAACRGANLHVLASMDNNFIIAFVCPKVICSIHLHLSWCLSRRGTFVSLILQSMTTFSVCWISFPVRDVLPVLHLSTVHFYKLVDVYLQIAVLPSHENIRRKTQSPLAWHKYLLLVPGITSSWGTVLNWTLTLLLYVEERLFELLLQMMSCLRARRRQSDYPQTSSSTVVLLLVPRTSK